MYIDKDLLDYIFLSYLRSVLSRRRGCRRARRRGRRHRRLRLHLLVRARGGHGRAQVERRRRPHHRRRPQRLLLLQMLLLMLVLLLKGHFGPVHGVLGHVF